MHQGDRRQGAAASGSGGVPEARASFADRLAVVDAAQESLAGFEQVLHECQGVDLGPAMGLPEKVGISAVFARVEKEDDAKDDRRERGEQQLDVFVEVHRPSQTKAATRGMSLAAKQPVQRSRAVEL